MARGRRSGPQIKFFLIAPIINPRVMSRAGIRQPFVAALEKATRNFERDYRSVSDKFDTVKPIYKRAIRYGVPPTGGDVAMYGIVTTDHPVMFYLDQGTSVRHVAMTSDFYPKTVGGLKTQRGRGGVSRFAPNRPGIKARGFSHAVAEENLNAFRQDVVLTVRVGAARFFLRSEIQDPSSSSTIRAEPGRWADWS